MLILHRYYLKIKFLPHRKNCVPIAKNIWAMRYGEVIAVYYGSYTKHVKWAKFRNVYVAPGDRPYKTMNYTWLFSQWCPCVNGTSGKLVVTHTLNWTVWLCGYWFSILWSRARFLSRMSSMMAEYFVLFLRICRIFLRHSHQWLTRAFLQKRTTLWTIICYSKILIAWVDKGKLLSRIKKN
jgi:hypothetical protein